MHRVTLVAPFLSSAEPDLAALLAGDPYALRDELGRSTGPWSWDRPDEGRVASLIEQHESTGAALAPGRLLSGRLGEVPAELSAQGVTVVEVTAGLHGVGCVVVWLELAELASLDALEDGLRHLVGQAARDVAAAVTAVVPVVPDVPTAGRYPRDAFLFWHRLLWSSATSAAWAARLCDEVEVRPGGGSRLRVGDGYSALEGGTDADVRAVVGGLVRAQEHWLMTEVAGQGLVLRAASLATEAPTSAAALRDAEDAAVRLAEREGLRAGLVRDELRYLTGTPRDVLEGCAASWRMPVDGHVVRDHLELLRGMLARRVEAQQSADQSRLNAVVLALTVVGALSLVLGVFETAVGGSVEALQVSRATVAAAVALLAAATLVLGLRRRPPRG